MFNIHIFNPRSPHGIWCVSACAVNVLYVQHALKCFSVPNSNRRRRRRDRNSLMRARMRYRKLHNLLNTYDEYAHAYLYKCLCVATNKNLQHKMMSAFSKSDACACIKYPSMCVCLCGDESLFGCDASFVCLCAFSDPTTHICAPRNVISKTTFKTQDAHAVLANTHLSCHVCVSAFCLRLLSLSSRIVATL